MRGSLLRRLLVLVRVARCEAASGHVAHGAEPRVARGRVALEAILSGGELASRREHSNVDGMTALDTIMGEVDELSRDC